MAAALPFTGIALALGAGVAFLFMWFGADPHDAQAAPQPTSDGFPRFLTGADDVRVRIPHPPQRVLPANTAIVDVLLEILPRERFAGLPAESQTYSALAGVYADRAADWGGLPQLATYKTESVLVLRPDLVLCHEWQGADTTSLLRANGVSVLVLSSPNRWDDVLSTIEIAGTALGTEERAQELLLALDERLDRLRQRARTLPVQRALSYSNLGAEGSAAGRGTTADVIFELLSWTNAAAEADLVGHTTVDMETLLVLDPDWIVVGTMTADVGSTPSEEFLRSRRELSQLRAVRENRIITLPQELFTTASQELLSAAELLLERALADR